MKYVYLVNKLDYNTGERFLSSIQSSEKKAKEECEFWKDIHKDDSNIIYYYIKEPVY